MEKEPGNVMIVLTLVALLGLGTAIGLAVKELFCPCVTPLPVEWPTADRPHYEFIAPLWTGPIIGSATVKEF